MMAVRQTVFHYVRVSLALLLCISAQANVNGSKALRLYFTSRSACCVLCIRQVEEKYKHSRGTMIMRHGLLRVWQAWRVRNGWNSRKRKPKNMHAWFALYLESFRALLPASWGDLALVSGRVLIF